MQKLLKRIIKRKCAKVFFTENRNYISRRACGVPRREPPKKQNFFGEPLTDRGAARKAGEENGRGLIGYTGNKIEK